MTWIWMILFQLSIQLDRVKIKEDQKVFFAGSVLGARGDLGSNQGAYTRCFVLEASRSIECLTTLPYIKKKTWNI